MTTGARPRQGRKTAADDGAVGSVVAHGQAWTIYPATCAGCRKPLLIARGRKSSFLCESIQLGPDGPASTAHDCPVFPPGGNPWPKAGGTP